MQHVVVYEQRRKYAQEAHHMNISEHPEIHAEHEQYNARNRTLHIHRSSIQLRCTLLVLLRKHRQVLRLRVKLREDCAALQYIVNVLHHDALHVLQLIVDVADVPSTIGQRFLGFLDVDVELDKLIGSRHRVDLSAVTFVEFLS